jgi:hypothetical protein
MSDLQPNPGPSARRVRGDRPPSAPRWVKVSGIIAFVLIGLVVASHLTGLGPSMIHGMHQP